VTLASMPGYIIVGLTAVRETQWARHGVDVRASPHLDRWRID